jgi:hypothetical protein
MFSMFCWPFTSGSFVKPGAQAFWVLGEIFPKMSNTPFERPCDTPFYLGGSFAMTPVFHQSIGANWVFDFTNRHELIAILAVEVCSLASS